MDCFYFYSLLLSVLVRSQALLLVYVYERFIDTNIPDDKTLKSFGPKRETAFTVVLF